MMTVGVSSFLTLVSGSVDRQGTAESQEAPFEIQDLGVGLYPNGINDSGMVVGIMVGGNRLATEAFVWAEEKGRVSLSDSEDSLTFANDISDNGLIVGHIGDEHGCSRAISWVGLTEERRFEPFHRGQSVVYAVNDRGYMAGQIGESTRSSYQAFRYDPSAGIRYLGTLGGDKSEATGLNDRGEVVGWSATRDEVPHAFRWNEQTGMADLGTLGGNRSFATAINSHGNVVGQAQTADGTIHAVVFEEDSIRDLGAPGGDWSLASDINDQGTIVGQTQAPPETTLPFMQALLDLGTRYLPSLFSRENALAVVWNEGEVALLQDLIPEGSGWSSLTAATGVNDRGQIVGFGRKNGHLHGFLLTPTDTMQEETTLVLAMNTDSFPAR